MVEHVIVRLQWIVCRGAVVMIEFVIARLHWAVNVETVRWIVVEKFCISTSSTGLLMPRPRLTHVGYLHHAEQARCTGPHDAIRPCDSAARSAGMIETVARWQGGSRLSRERLASEWHGTQRYLFAQLESHRRGTTWLMNPFFCTST